jgi:trimeric autotransporter adhesin
MRNRATFRRAGYALLGLPVLLAAAEPPRFTITTIAGSNEAGDFRLATEAQLVSVEGLATDALGNLYIADTGDHRIRVVSPSGIIRTLAGDGTQGFAGDGELAVAGQVASPYDVAVDTAGRVFFADYQNLRIRRVTSDGQLGTVAGGGERPGDGDGQALGIRFLGPRNVALDAAGNLYIADFADHRIYRLANDGHIEAVAGNGVRGEGRDTFAVASELDAPAGLAVDRYGSIWLADSGNRRIRRVQGGRIWTVSVQVDGEDVLRAPVAVAFHPNGDLYIADSVPGGPDRVWRYTPSGAVDLVFETGADLPELARIRALCVDAQGNLYLGGGAYVARIGTAGQLARVAGGADFRAAANGSPAFLSYLASPRGLALDRWGSIYLAESSESLVRRIDTANRIYAFAGGGSMADGSAAVSARLISPVAVAYAPDGSVHIADALAHRVRTVRHPLGIIQTLAGTGNAGFSGDTGNATIASLNRPSGLAIDAEGNVYISDQGNLRVRRIGRDGRIVTWAGSGVRGYFGDGGPARDAQLNFPGALAVDAAGNLYIADTGNHVVRRVTPDGIIATWAGSGVRGYGGDGGPAASAALNLENPGAMAVDAEGNLYIADSFNHRIRCVTPNGIIYTVAGTGTAGFRGDGGLAREARLSTPAGLATDPDGNLYVADTSNHRIRLLLRAPLPPEPIEEPEPVTVLHAASFTPGPVAPNQIVSLFGHRIGGPETEVRFDGLAATVFFAEGDQVNALVPSQIAVKDRVTVEVYRDGRLRGHAAAAVTALSPGLFTLDGGKGNAIAMHEDGTLNSRDNPAPRGSIVTLWATGEGVAKLPVSVRVGLSFADLLYAGPAPGFPGLMQINARLPGPFSPPGEHSLLLHVSNTQTQPGVTIFLK